MNLNLMLYLADVVGNLKAIMNLLGVVSLGTSLLFILIWIFSHEDHEKKARLWASQTLKIFLPLLLISSTLCAIIPRQQTIYLMMGVNAAEAVIENPNVKQISGRVFDILNKKLDELEEKKEEKK